MNATEDTVYHKALLFYPIFGTRVACRENPCLTPLTGV